MQAVLQHINSVDGVIGSAIFGEHGEILAHTFPPLIDDSTLKKTSTICLECLHGLQIAQSLDVLDMRYAEGRIIIKAFSGATLCLLCAKTVNLQVLVVTLNLAVRKLETLLPKDEQLPAIPVEEKLYDSADSGVLKLKISHLANRDASSSFDSLGMIAVSQPTSSYVSDYYKQSFKKLVLSNKKSGTSGVFPVMVMKDLDHGFDGTIIVGPGIEKKLKVNEGDMIEVTIA